MSDLGSLVGAAQAPPGPPPPRGRARARHLWHSASRGITSRGDILAVIAAGGAIGSLARWGLSQAAPAAPGAFAWATFIANVTGCYLLGALMVLLSDMWRPSRYLRPFLGVGVLGGYTTFSTYMLGARAMLVSGHAATAGAYLFGTLAAGLAAVWLGVTTIRILARLARARARAVAGRRAGAPAASPPRGDGSPR